MEIVPIHEKITPMPIDKRDLPSLGEDPRDVASRLYVKEEELNRKIAENRTQELVDELAEVKRELDETLKKALNPTKPRQINKRAA